MKKFNLTAIQYAINQEKIDGWVFADKNFSDPINQKILNIPVDLISQRQWFFYIPKNGAPKKLVHGLESKILNHLPGKKEIYLGREEMSAKLKRFFKSSEKIALHYSASESVPAISHVSAGLMELLKACKIIPVSAAELIQKFTSVLNKAQINTHLNVAGILTIIQHNILRYIERKIKNHQEVTELSLQNYILKQLKNNGLISDRPPAVACGLNTADPNYSASEQNNQPVYPKSLIQITYSGKEKDAEAVYATTSFVAYIGMTLPEEYEHHFQILCTLREKMVNLIDQSFKLNKPVHGWEIDRKMRDIISEEGLDGHYLLPSGRSLGSSLVTYGVELDDFESRDERKIAADLCLALSPALYFSEYGMKSEINIITGTKGIQNSSKTQQDSIFHINP